MIVNTCLLLMIKTNGMDAKNSDLKGHIFPQSQYFPQLARNVLILH